MLERAKIELGTTVMAVNHLPSEDLTDLVCIIERAQTPAAILDCLVLLEEKRIPVTASLTESVRACLPENLEHLVVELTSNFMAKLPPELFHELLSQAEDSKTISALVRFLVRSKLHGVSAFDLPGLGTPTTASTSQTSPLDDLPEASKTTPKRTPRPRRKKPSDELATGMSPSRDNGEYHTSPQKDLVRKMWMERLAGSLPALGKDPSELRLFSLFGEEMLELPGYEKLGITPDHMHGAEFDPAIFARMNGRVPIHLFEGNCYAFSQALKKKQSPLEFDIMNLDLCGFMDDFFLTYDAALLSRLAPHAQLSINTRIRQDYMGLDAATFNLTPLVNIVPEIQTYFDMLFDQKKKLYKDETVARNMALREIFFISSFFGSLPYHLRACCRSQVEDAINFTKGAAWLGHRIMTQGVPEAWGTRPVEVALQYFRHVGAQDILSHARKIPQEQLIAMKRQVHHQASRAVRATGQSAWDFQRDLDQDALPDFIPEEDMVATPAEEKEIESYMRLFMATRDRIMTSAYLRQKVAGIQRVTYTHDTNHTFQTWMLSMERAEKRTVIQAMLEALELLVNSPDTAIDGNMGVRKSAPQAHPLRVKIARGRILDHHQKRKPRRRKLTGKEATKRDRKNKLAKDARWKRIKRQQKV